LLTTREYRSLADARAALAGRLDRAHAPCLFDRIDWFDDLARACFPDASLRLCRAAEGEAEAWLFLRRSGERQLAGLANWYSFRWRPVFLGRPDAAMRQRLLTALARDWLRDTAQVGLHPIFGDSLALLDALRAAGWLYVRRTMGGHYRLDMNGRDFATYWAQRPGHLRALVRRKGRGEPFALSIERRLTDALWQDFLSVQTRSWQGEEPDPAFLRLLATRESAAGTLRLGFARTAEGRPVAAQLWTVENGVALIHKLAHDRALDARSPGTLLSHAMFAAAIDGDHVETIDYGTGDNPYKIDWMDDRLPRQRIDCFNPRFASSWLPAARTAISALVG
jgi:hypothetical protein